MTTQPAQVTTPDAAVGVPPPEAAAAQVAPIPEAAIADVSADPTVSAAREPLKPPEQHAQATDAVPNGNLASSMEGLSHLPADQLAKLTAFFAELTAKAEATPTAEVQAPTANDNHQCSGAGCAHCAAPVTKPVADMAAQAAPVAQVAAPAQHAGPAIAANENAPPIQAASR